MEEIEDIGPVIAVSIIVIILAVLIALAIVCGVITIGVDLLAMAA